METTQTLPSDESLVSAVLGGSSSAFGDLVRRYERAVRAVCLAVLRDHHLACDVAQDAFLAAYRSLAGLRNRAAFGTWLTTIARHRAIHFARKRRPEAPLPPSLDQRPAPEPYDFELLSAIAALPERERVLVMLRYFDDHDISAIAAIVGRSPSTVSKQISRARERLRRALAKEVMP